jgi:hypothetical protein
MPQESRYFIFYLEAHFLSFIFGFFPSIVLSFSCSITLFLCPSFCLWIFSSPYAFFNRNFLFFARKGKMKKNILSGKNVKSKEQEKRLERRLKERQKEWIEERKRIR